MGSNIKIKRKHLYTSYDWGNTIKIDKDTYVYTIDEHFKTQQMINDISKKYYVVRGLIEVHIGDRYKIIVPRESIEIAPKQYYKIAGVQESIVVEVSN